MNFLQGTRFLLDATRGRFSWWRRLPPPGVTLPVVYDADRLPGTSLELGDRKVRCVLDTAEEGGFTLPWELRPKGKGSPSFNLGFTGTTVAGSMLEVPRLAAGGAFWRDVPAHFQEHGENGLMGLGVFAAAPVCFDFVVNQVTFTGAPGRDLPFLREAPRSLPLFWERRNGTAVLKVLLIKQGSAMERASLLPGDEVVSAGSLSGSGLTRRGIKCLLASGRGHTWTVRRGNRELTLTFAGPNPGR
jgi:hypothetical protein